MNRSTLRAFLIFIGIDWPFSVLLTAAYAISLNLTHFDEYLLVGLLYLPIFIVKQVAVSLFLALKVGYLDRWVMESRRGQCDAESARDAAKRHFRLPIEYSLFFISVWIVSYPLLSLLLTLVPGAGVNVGNNIYYVTLFLIATVFFGATAVGFISMGWALEPAAEEISKSMSQNEIFHKGKIFSLRSKTLILTLSICYAATGLIGSLAYKFRDHESLAIAKFQGKIGTESIIAQLQDIDAPSKDSFQATLESYSQMKNSVGVGLIYNHERRSIQSTSGFKDKHRVALLERLHDVSRQDLPEYSRGRGWLCLWQPLTEQNSVGVFIKDDPQEINMSWLSIIIFGTSIIIFPIICGFLYSSMIGLPVERLHEASDRLLRTGQIKSFQHIPVYHRDEVGNCVETLNTFLRNLKVLSLQTREVAEGNLNVELARKGDLHSDFQYMIDSLRKTVRQISQESVVLSNFGADILAASLQQESVSQEQATSISTISLSMNEIRSGLGKVSDSLYQTQGNVEVNLKKVEDSLHRVNKLKERSDEIHSILANIRKISNKSRYLALNTYIEASRAGSDGASFRVIAKETRQLSETVGESVGDIEKLVAKIRSASTKSVEVTNDSREFALDTAKLAEGISIIADKQNQSIYHVAKSVDDLSAAIHETAVTSRSNRALAENLSELADRLANMFSDFQIDSAAESGDRTKPADFAEKPVPKIVMARVQQASDAKSRSGAGNVQAESLAALFPLKEKP